MTQWLIGIFVRLLSSKDNLINCGGGDDEQIGYKFVLSRSLFLYDSNFFSTLFLSKTLSSKKRKKSSQIPCIGPLFVLNYYGAVKNSY